MPNVYIPNSAGHNYRYAKKFGELIALTEGNLDLVNTSAIIRKVAPYIEASSGDDYILVSGAAVVNSIVCSMFVAKHNKLNLLIFRRNGRYIERNITF